MGDRSLVIGNKAARKEKNSLQISCNWKKFFCVLREWKPLTPAPVRSEKGYQKSRFSVQCKGLVDWSSHPPPPKKKVIPPILQLSFVSSPSRGGHLLDSHLALVQVVTCTDTLNVFLTATWLRLLDALAFFSQLYYTPGSNNPTETCYRDNCICI